MKQAQQIAAVGVLVFMGWFGLGLLRAHDADAKRRVEGSPPDTKFCQEQLSYYESFCKVYPKNCTEGPRKLARCDQGWNLK